MFDDFDVGPQSDENYSDLEREEDSRDGSHYTDDDRDWPVERDMDHESDWARDEEYMDDEPRDYWNDVASDAENVRTTADALSSYYGCYHEEDYGHDIGDDF